VAMPFYIHYTNSLNIHETTTIGAWGYGGYELEKKVEPIIGNKDFVIWADREGFNRFFSGENYWRGVSNPFNPDLDIDYLILSNDGERIFLKALNAWGEGRRYFYSREAANTPILEYYKKEPIEKFCINDNPNLCTWLIQMDKNDILVPAEDNPSNI